MDFRSKRKKKLDEWALMKAKMCYFYSWDYRIIDDMDYHDFLEYWKAITIIEAQQTLVKMTISDYPHSKAEQRREIHKNIYKQAYPIDEQKVVSSEDMYKILKGI